MASEDTAAQATDQPTVSAPEAGDTAGAASQPTEQTAAQGQSAEGAEEPQSDEIRAELQRVGEVLAKVPAPVRKEYQRAITQAFQRASEKTKPYEPYKQLIESFQQDPAATVKGLAQHFGIIPKEQSQPVQQATDETLAELAAVVGEDEAKRLAPAFEKLAKRVVENETKAIKQQTDYATAQLAREQSAAIMKSFGEKHPGWEKHEPKMMEIAGVLKPNGMNEAEYLETLFKLATYDIQSAEQTKKVLDKIGQAAQASEPVAAGVNASRVSPTPQKYTSPDAAFDAAADAARKGVVW